jgi:hypothetical protein
MAATVGDARLGAGVGDGPGASDVDDPTDAELDVGDGTAGNAGGPVAHPAPVAATMATTRMRRTRGIDGVTAGIRSQRGRGSPRSVAVPAGRP